MACKSADIELRHVIICKIRSKGVPPRMKREVSFLAFFFCNSNGAEYFFELRINLVASCTHETEAWNRVDQGVLKITKQEDF